MLAAGTVAAFAAHVPLRHLLGVDVVVDGVATVASRASWSLHVARGIISRPPIRSGIGHMVLQPLFVAYVPLHGQRIVVVANLGKYRCFHLLP